MSTFEDHYEENKTDPVDRTLSNHFDKSIREKESGKFARFTLNNFLRKLAFANIKC